MISYDYTPLTSVVDRDDIDDYRKRVTTNISGKITPSYHFVPLISFMFGVMGYLPARITEGVTGDIFFLVLIIGLFVLIGFIEGWHLCVTVPHRAWVRMVRLARFAQSNKLSYMPPGRSRHADEGLLFRQPNSLEVFDSIHKSGKKLVYEFGNASVVRARVIHPLKAYNWGFIRITLDQPVPHIVLDSKVNKHLLVKATLPDNFRRSRIKGVSEEFYQCFTVYATKDHKRDSLHIFSPSMIELLMGVLHNYDIELVNRSLYLYKRKWFDLSNPETIKEILTIIDDIEAALEKRAGDK